MNLDMGALAVGTLTAFLFGGLLWLLFFALSFLSLVLFGKSRKTKNKGAGGVWWEIEHCLFLVFASLAGIVFLYAVNRGVFRWFLCAAIPCGYFLSRRLFGGVASRTGQFMARKVRCFAYFVFYYLTFPARLFLRLFLRLIDRSLHKIRLRLGRLYDTLNVKKFDQRKRGRLHRETMRELRQIYRP